MLTLEGEGGAAETEWFANRFDTDYYTLLDVRNEAAVAFLALGHLDAYRYNNGAYTALYKQISEDTSLEGYCRQMQSSANNKIVAIILCLILLLVFLVGYYVLYFRHRLMYRYNLEQVLEINRQVFSASLQETDKDIASCLADTMLEEVNELMAVDALGIAVYNEDTRNLMFGFSPDAGDHGEMRELMVRCFQSQTMALPEGSPTKCLPC